MNNETLYCICRKSYDSSEFMIECDICQDWFHGSCVGIKEHLASEIETYHCPECQKTHGPLTLKKKRQAVRIDYDEEDGSLKNVQTGSISFVNELKRRTFLSEDKLPILRLSGYDVNQEYLDSFGGFKLPIIVPNKEGLNLKIPPATFTVQDVENYVGSMLEIDVIDVAKQEDCKMLMRDWTIYYNSPEKKNIYNVISLEFSQTRLGELVSPPQLVSQLSWISRYWLNHSVNCYNIPVKPKVQKYCLMGVKDSFTDFHIDFGGTCVWYHILRGEKVFYLITPNQANLTLYERWLSSSNQGQMFFGDQVDACYRIVVKQGETLFLPTGWIHAVLTPIDSLVFGGNFLSNYNIELQIKVYEMERRVKTLDKYLFPYFETLHWYAAKAFYDLTQSCIERDIALPQYLLLGIKALISALKSWTSIRKDLNELHEDIPNCPCFPNFSLIKALQKDLKAISVLNNSSTQHSSQYNSIYQKNVSLEENLSKKANKRKLTQYNNINEEIENKDEIKSLEPFAINLIGLKNNLEMNNKSSPTCRLKMFGGKIISSEYEETHDEDQFPDNYIEINPQGDQLKVENVVEEVYSENIEDENCERNLVVDEKQNYSLDHLQHKSAIKPASLRVPVSNLETSFVASSDFEKRLHMPLITGGLNNSISDILEVSGYGTETDIKVDAEFKDSPTMRDAIQGMLSMSQMGRSSLARNSSGANLHSLNYSGSKDHYRKYFPDDDIEEQLNSCYKDEEFVYPSLIYSEDEDNLLQNNFKQSKSDQTWNPKGTNVKPNCAKVNRPQRKGAKKESVESGLAEAAAKLASSNCRNNNFNDEIKKSHKSTHIKAEMKNTASKHFTHFSSSPPNCLLLPSTSTVNIKNKLELNSSLIRDKKTSKPKKGLATSKQRLAQKLKISKIFC